jgi:5-methylcytosine-specific restriction endonuclease McrA
MTKEKLSLEELAARRASRLQARYAREREERAAKAVAEGRPIGKRGSVKRYTEEEAAVRQAESTRRSKERHKVEIAARRSASEKALRAARALAEGREPGKSGQPRKNRTEEEMREYRRVKQAKWSAANRERARQIGRESMKRAAAVKAIEAGREPGKKGKPKQFTSEEKIAKQTARGHRYYHANGPAQRAAAARRERENRADKKAGTFVPKSHPKLTEEQRKQQQVRMSQKRRARLRAAFGDGYTLKDIEIIRARQNGLCNMADCDQSLRPENETLDHVYPLALGGTHEMGNFQLLCQSCNSRKGAKHPSGFKFRFALHCW